MKRLFLLFSVSLLLAGCVSTQVSFDGQQIYRLADVFGDSGFFLYSQGSEVIEDTASVTVRVDNCDVVLSKKMPTITADVDVNTKHSDGVTLSSWFLNDVLVRYVANIDETDYVFYVGEGNSNVSQCLNNVELLAGSFSVVDKYANSEYGYTVDFLNDFDITDLKDGGFKMIKHICDGECEDGSDIEEKGDIVEIYVTAKMDSGQMNDYIYSKYEGYTIDFTNLGVLSVAFVDEVKDGMAMRHCFIFNDGVRYEFLLKVPTLKYSEYKSVFDDFCFSFEKI